MTDTFLLLPSKAFAFHVNYLLRGKLPDISNPIFSGKYEQIYINSNHI